ncbi:ECs_2282 family putative zinc-binding protein [Falsirhodobacter sp. 1013]|uniref:ECs_2282 family putative zinc-binding protein n=1 Tax=Falsirhodobacter sp. 1013 TaxID=3417566 RepID=UPI003EBAD1C5
MAENVSVTFQCKACGADPTTLELPDNHTDDSIAKCKHCGAVFGRYGDIVKMARDKLKAEMVAKTKAAFKGLKGWKVK